MITVYYLDIFNTQTFDNIFNEYFSAGFTTSPNTCCRVWLKAGHPGCAVIEYQQRKIYLVVYGVCQPGQT